MRIAYFDASAGVSGDMILGALVDAGLGLEGLERELRRLNLSGYRLSAEETRRAGFRATRITVTVAEEHHHEGEGGHGRRLPEILELIHRSDLDPSVKERAALVFRRLGEAEARVHGRPISETHLHEAGAVDALVDVVGAVAGLAALGVERVVFSPLRLGYGTVRSAHGLLPIPPPAVAELIKGVPVYAGEYEGEMVTPTGAALATTLAESFGPMPFMIPVAVGVGAGSAERAIPNVLRLFLGDDRTGAEEGCEELVVLETNLDDMNPEFCEYLSARLFAAGALDVWLVPVQMKKGRPGIVLHVLAAPGEAEELRALIFAESTTLGLREHRVARYALARETLTVMVEGEAIRVKVGRRGGRAVQAAPEYEDCRRVAERTGRPLKEIYRLVTTLAWEGLAVSDGEGTRGGKGDDARA